MDPDEMLAHNYIDDTAYDPHDTASRDTFNDTPSVDVYQPINLPMLVEITRVAAENTEAELTALRDENARLRGVMQGTVETLQWGMGMPA